jgi:hypothetical protein
VIRLYRTRLMRRGEIALWHRGMIVWHGNVGAEITGISFDAVSMNIADGERMAALAERKIVDADTVLAALANWWSS